MEMIRLPFMKLVKEAADRGRRGEGPTLIETVSYRMTPHSSDDDDRSYRTQDEVVEGENRRILLITFLAYLKEVGTLDEEKEKEINERVRVIVNEATDYAEKAPFAEPEHVYELCI